MNIGQAFRMAFKSIRTNRIRSMLTMLGIIIGVAAVIIMVSIVQGSNQKMKAYYESMGTNKITVSAHKWNGQDVTGPLYEFCQGLGDLVLGVTPSGSYSGPIGYQSKTTEAMEQGSPTVSLGSDQFSLCNNFTLEKGRDLSYLDVKDCHPVVVLGARTAEFLFNYQDPVGKTVSIGGQPFLVAGVYKAKDAASRYSMDNMAVVPYTMGRLLNKSTSIDQFVVKAKSSETTDRAIAKLNQFLAGQIGEGSGSYYVYSENQGIQQSNDQNAMMSLVLGGIAGISLLVGGIGIMNIMLVTVSERTREIGIRKAIGAQRRSILLQFLIESSVVCGIGGLLGIALGVAGTLVAGRLILGLLVLPNLAMSAGAFAFSVLLGVGFGMYPAVKASGLQPVAALRAD